MALTPSGSPRADAAAVHARRGSRRAVSARARVARLRPAGGRLARTPLVSPVGHPADRVLLALLVLWAAPLGARADDAGPPPPTAPVSLDAGALPSAPVTALDAGAPDDTAAADAPLAAEDGAAPPDAARPDAAAPDAAPPTPPAPARCALDLRPPMNALPCGLCHVEPPPAPVDCARCHQQPPPHADLGACVDCHLPDRPFADAPFDHAARAGFALTGPHALRRCADCHPPGAPPARDACVACHADRHRGGAGQTCADCHTADTWLLVRFDHATTGFSLTGRHLGVPCVDCHPAGRFVGQPADCVFCHGEQLPRGHRFAGARDCADCHRPTTFSAPGFVHDPPVATGGVHARVATACGRCHTGAALDADDCARCHLRDLSAPHRAFLVDAGELLDCTRCHDRAAPWTANSFRHPLTLTGAHVGLPCGACHPLPPAIRAGAEACRSCHLADQPPRNHPAGRDCVDCHTTAAFYPAIFR